MNPSDVLDAVIEAPVVTSFTRIGYDVRSRSDHWRALSSYDLTGRTVLVTGATSGLGRCAASTFVSLGARVIAVGRDRAKTERVAAELRALTSSAVVDVVVADMGELDQVRAAAAAVLALGVHVDVLVHNAGALTSSRVDNAAGVEMTVASQVVGPFLLTSLLLPVLSGAERPGRVLTMSSGGMYASPLRVDDIEMDATSYKGSEQYARTKRAQVTLNELWAERVPASSVVFHALHPGWALTPGVETSLPTFRRIVGPLLRTPEQGADTLVWLAADDGAPLASSGGFWLDRRRRPIHKTPTTKRSDTAAARASLWAWCVRASGAVVPG